MNAAFDQGVSSLKRPWRVWIASICFAFDGGAAAFVLTSSSLLVFDPRTTPVGRALGADLADYNTQMSNSREARSMGDDLQTVYIAPRDRVLSKIESNAGNDAFNAIVDVFRVHAAAVLEPSDRAAQLEMLSSSAARFNPALSDGNYPYLLELLVEIRPKNLQRAAMLFHQRTCSRVPNGCHSFFSNCC